MPAARSVVLTPSTRASQAVGAEEADRLPDGLIRATGRHLDDEVLGHGLFALAAEVTDPAEDVQLRHVAGRAAARDLVADGTLAVDFPFE